MRFNKEMAIAFLVAYFGMTIILFHGSFLYFLFHGSFGLAFTILWGYIGGAMP